MNSNEVAKQVSLEDKEILALLEAALYVAGRPLDPRTLGSVVKIRSKKKIQVLVRNLVAEYLKYDGALELMELDDGRFVLQLKPQYVSSVKRLVMRPLLSSGPLKTLAYIAYRQPVAQAHVVAVRGSQAYIHIQDLKSLGLLTTENLGKTKLLRTTEVFADYFNLSRDLRLMKHQLKALFDATNKTDDSQEDKRKASPT